MNREVTIEAENGDYIGRLESITVDEEIESGQILEREVKIEIAGPLFKTSNLPPFMERENDQTSGK